MCGILGHINFDHCSTAHPRLDLLQHRGPDGRGEWENKQGTVYFGHTRLAILEPTPAGQQPMSDASGRFVLTFNGEIYNHLELRSLVPLERWRGTSDTETLVELMAFMGIDALHLLKGMFAFALYDYADGSVLLVRDRLGIKPLWYCWNNHEFRFSSEVRVLLKPGESVLTDQALSEYLAFGRMPGSGEIFNGVYILPAGNWMKLHPEKGIKQKCWWPIGSFNCSMPQNRREVIKRVRQLVTKAINEHLISDVGIGAFLSGGVDSSIVAMVAGKVLGKSLRTFTIGFPQSELDERYVARQVAKLAGSEHFELEINEEMCLTCVKEAVVSLDLPSVDAINTYIVSKAVRNTGLKVALSGLGGDELFGGYPSFKNVPFMAWLGKLPKGISSQLIRVMPKSLCEKLAGVNNYNITQLAIARRRFTSVAKLKSLGLGNGTPHIPVTPDRFDTMSKISWAEIHGYMIPMLLRDSDQMSMAVGLEIRVPFLDHNLVEEVLDLAQDYKQGRFVKSLLVEAFLSDLPSEVYNRPKQGFALPMNDWIRGPLAEFVNEGVHAAAELLQLKEPFLQLHRFTNENLHWTRIWNWCTLGHWMVKQGSSVSA